MYIKYNTIQSINQNKTLHYIIFYLLHYTSFSLIFVKLKLKIKIKFLKKSGK